MTEMGASPSILRGRYYTKEFFDDYYAKNGCWDISIDSKPILLWLGAKTLT